MSIRRPASLLVLTILSACAASGSDEAPRFHLGFPHLSLPHFGGGGSATLQKDAEAGAPVLLWGDTSLGDTCVPIGETRLEAASGPEHGALVVKPGRLYAVYPDGDKHAACSGRLVTGMLAYYTAEKAYTGADQVVLKATRADGDAQKVTVDIEVLPARAPAPRPIARPAQPPTPERPILRSRPISPDAPAPAVLQTPYPGG